MPIRPMDPRRRAGPTWSRWRGRIWSIRSWTLRAAAAADYRDIFVPPPYLNGMSQLARTLQREAEMQAAALKA